MGTLGVSSFIPLRAQSAIESTAALLRDESDHSSEFMISNWKTSEGLPVNEIQDLKESPDGYLWLGTHQGLVRFDGIRFQTFFSAPSGNRFGTRVGPMEVDARGKLWVAPDQIGLLYRDTDEFREVLTNNSGFTARVVNLCSDGTNGLMWVDGNHGVGRISMTSGPRGPQFSIEHLPNNGILNFARWMRDVHGGLWLENSRTLKRFEKGNFHDVALPGTATLVAAPRNAGGMWVAREAKLRFVTASGESHEIATFPWKGQSRVNILMEDRHNRLWIGTAGAGLYCYANNEFRQIIATSSTVSSLLEDAQDNIWAGTRGGGLFRVRKRQFFVHDVRSGLQNEFVRSLAEDKEGRMWVLTAEGGAGWFEAGVFHALGEAEGWRHSDALSIRPMSDGTVWISTIRRGMWRFSNGRISRREFDKPLREPPVDMLEDKRGRLWMVTDNNGIYCLDQGKLSNYSAAEGLPSPQIRQIILDDKGDLWAGDWEGGVARLRDDHWEIIRKPTGHGDAVRSMAAADGVVWIGTSAGGLLRLKNGETQRVSVDEGLPNACIQELLLDGRGYLWGGTPHRLFRLSLKHVNAVMDGREPRVQAITYGRGDGLPDASFGNWFDPRCYRTKDGELWFATASGAIHFRPEELIPSKVPHTIIEQTLLDGKTVEPDSLQHLRPGPARLEFRFTAPCLSAPERVHFRYQLSGVDQMWVDAGTTRTATYASIPAGDHTFRVSACSPDGEWSAVAATTTVSVHPFYWQTKWFLACVVALVTGGAVWMLRRAAVQRLRRRLELMRQQQAVERERARIAQDIHDELGANLTSIGLLADMGARHKTDPAAVTRELDQISQTARESVAAMDAIVWALNPRNDSLDHFANYIAQFTREFFRPTSMRTRLDLPVDLPPQPMSTETRHQLFLIVKECFNNIVRHSEATEVNLKLACDNGGLRLTIADNGKGLSGQPGEGHDGLNNLRERIEGLGGTLCIESKKGRGAKLEFILPLTNIRTT